MTLKGHDDVVTMFIWFIRPKGALMMTTMAEAMMAEAMMAEAEFIFVLSRGDFAMC